MHCSVKVEHWNDKDMVATYAILDNCSQGSLVKELGIHGTKTTLNLKTLHMEKAESIMVVDGLLLDHRLPK